MVDEVLLFLMDNGVLPDIDREKLGWEKITENTITRNKEKTKGKNYYDF